MPLASFVAVVRQDYALWRFDLSETQAALLRRLIAIEPLERALGDIEATPTEIERCIGDWVSHGMFASVTLDGE